MPLRGNLYQKLILAAKSVLDDGGRFPKRLADVAMIAEVSEAEAMQCFRSVDELHDGLIYHGVTLLNDALRAAMIGVPSRDPERQLRSLARCYGEWAQENPALFRLLVEGLNGPIPPDSALHRFTMSMRDLFQRKFHEMRELGTISADADIDRVILMLHCFVKGANVMLVAHGSDPWVQDDPHHAPYMATDMFDDFLTCILVTNAPGTRLRGRTRAIAH